MCGMCGLGKIEAKCMGNSSHATTKIHSKKELDHILYINIRSI